MSPFHFEWACHFWSDFVTVFVGLLEVNEVTVLEGLVFGLAIVGFCHLISPGLGFISDGFVDGFDPLLHFRDVLLNGFLSESVDGEVGEGGDREFPAEEDQVWRFASAGGRCGVVCKGDIMHVIRPLFAIGQETDGEVFDDLAVDSLDVSLALGPVDNGGPLVDAHNFASGVGELVFELRPIIT